MIFDKASAAKNIRWKIGILLVWGFLASAAWGQAPLADEKSEAPPAATVERESKTIDRRDSDSGDDDELADSTMSEYRIELDAPGAVSGFLQRYLDLYRMQRRKDLSDEDFLLLVEQTPQNVQSLLKTQGYFNAEAESWVTEGDDGVTVHLRVVPGQQVIVTKVDVRVTGAIEQDEETMTRFRRALDRWLWRLPEGAPFDQTAWDESKRRAHDYIVSRHYATATIASSKAEIDPKTHQAILTLEIASGQAYVFGEVSIIGIERYPENVVRDLIRFRPGDGYQRRDLLDLQSELQGLPYFGGVLVEALPSVEAPYVAPVVVTVQEVPHNKLDLGVGYSTNYGLRLQTRYAYNNVLSRGWVFDTQLNLSANEKQGEVGLSFPRKQNGYEHRLYVAYNDSNLQGIRSRASKWGASRTKTHNKIERMMSVEFLNENRHDDYGTEDSLKALPFTYRWVKRDVRTQRNPRRGNIVQLEGSAALKGLLTDESFIRLYGRGVQYWPVGDKHVALARLEVGQTFTRHPGKVPSDYLFRAGGSNSVRGYDYQSLGIIHRTTAWPGRVLATGSFEYQHTVYGDWRAAAFVDYGDAADRWSDWSGKAGVGVGARWASPVGMLGADLAYGVDAKTWRFYFSLGMSF
ncbi:MAG: autotransporter assembly complex protein TamA [Burkholderiales bacterium]|jgi:translocation and assembly module TamA|nr:autotransporter assembly complex protein TamA [Burkholderiales bacterium]